MATVRELLEAGSERLRRANLDSPAREAALLLRTLLGMSPSALLAHDDDAVDPVVAARFERRIERRAAREPAAYLLGSKEFWGREFVVDDRVLVPRPESEHLIEIALGLPLPERARVLDVGTGSGCIALTIAAERPLWRVTAAERSPAALAVARVNAARLGLLERVAFVASDVSSALRLECFDLVVANLPYVDESVRGAPELALEPELALFAPREGLGLIERMRSEAAALRPGAYLACEIGASQADALADGADPAVWELIELRRDLAGLDRDLVWRRRAAR